MKQRIVLKKKSDHEKFVIPYMVGGDNYPNALSDTSSSVSIMPKLMAYQLSLKIEPYGNLFTFEDCSKVNSEGIVKKN